MYGIKRAELKRLEDENKRLRCELEQLRLQLAELRIRGNHGDCTPTGLYTQALARIAALAKELDHCRREAK